jgi:hypothetical protein
MTPMLQVMAFTQTWQSTVLSWVTQIGTSEVIGNITVYLIKYSFYRGTLRTPLPHLTQQLKYQRRNNNQIFKKSEFVLSKKD